MFGYPFSLGYPGNFYAKTDSVVNVEICFAYE
jgi:hypothetical protein